jgi:hypothetical protein
MGGTMGVGMGVIEGAAIGQIVGGQIGGISIASSQSGCICLLTHSHVHSALALVPIIMKVKASDTTNEVLTASPPPLYGSEPWR